MKKKIIGILIVGLFLGASTVPNISGNIEEKQNITYGFDEPPTPPIINGPPTGRAGKEYTYKFMSTDPQGYDLSIVVNWGDSTSGYQYGPYPSGTVVTLKHSWPGRNNYTIKAYALVIKGDYLAYSNYSTFEVIMSKNKVFTFFNIHEYLIYRFPFFEKILKQYYFN